MGAKHSPWWVQNTEQPPPHSVLYSLPGHHHSQCWQCSGSLPLLPADWRSPNKEKLHSRYLQRCSRTGELRIYSRSAFPVIPSMSRGFFLPDQFRLGLREVGKLPCQGGGQWPGVLSSNSIKESPSASPVGLQPCFFWPLSDSPSASEVPHLQPSCSGTEPSLKHTRRFRQSLVLASLVSSAERFGLQDRSLVRAAWNMPSPVQFQLYRLVSFFWNMVIA